MSIFIQTPEAEKYDRGTIEYGNIQSALSGQGMKVKLEEAPKSLRPSLAKPKIRQNSQQIISPQKLKKTISFLQKSPKDRTLMNVQFDSEHSSEENHGYFP